jgi:hypothetical protein
MKDTMAQYAIGEYVLASNVALPELVRAGAQPPDCTFLLLPEARAAAADQRWFHHWLSPNQEVWVSFAKQGADYLLRFPGLADFLVSADGREVRCHPRSGTPLETIRHLLLDQVFPLVLSKRGKLALHASAVLSHGGAVAFVGAAGRGKSTLALSFAQQGAPVMTDDCLLLELKQGQLFGMPSYSGLRLWDDAVEALFELPPALTEVAHYTSKKRLVSGAGPVGFSTGAAPVQRIYFLASADEMAATRTVEIARLSARQAFIELFSHAYKLDITDRDMLAREFDLLRRVATLPLFYRLAFPRDFARLPAVRAAIASHLEEG